MPPAIDAAVTRRAAARSPLIPALLRALVLVAIVVAIVLLGRRSAVVGATRAARPTVAVLPFENLGTPKDEYFADGVTDEMTSRLAGISRLRVTSRTTAMHYKGTDKTLREIGDELGVQYVLEGTVRTDRTAGGDGQVRVTPQLIRVADDTHLWTDRYAARLAPGEIFAVQGAIAERVAAALNVTLLGRERLALRHVPTNDLAAYDAYLLGRFSWNRRSAESIERATEHFERAITLDPDFAEAYAGLADTYTLYGRYDVPGVPPAEAYVRAETAARRAIALDSALAAAHASLGIMLACGRWDWASAERELRRAIELDPDYAVARYWYAELLIILGRADEAITQAAYAVGVDPAALVAQHILGIARFLAGRPNEAIAPQRAVVDLEPGFPYSHYWIALAYLLQRRFDAAGREFRAMGVPAEVAAAVVDAVRDPSARARALPVISRYGRRVAGERGVHDPTYVAGWYALAGAADSAFARLEDALRTRSEGFLLIARSPTFASLHEDPRWADLLRRLGLAR